METVPAKSIVIRTPKGNSWFGCDYTMNIYRGCNHGCIYCDSRSDCYHITDFDKVRAKEDALRIIRDDLRRKVKKGVVATGSMSDPYNPFEAQEKLTRHALELLSAFGFGVAVATKSSLVTRDIDLLSEIKASAPVIIKLTVTTADDALAKIIEPNAPAPSERFRALAALSEAGIFAGILLMPVLPFLEDSEENVLAIVRKTAEAGGRFVYPAFGMTLRSGNRQHYFGALDRHFPDVREQYETRYGMSYQCSSPRAKKLWSVFCAECGRLGLLYNMTDIVRTYKIGYEFQQLSLM